jgi:hypothetical protein
MGQHKEFGPFTRSAHGCLANPASRFTMQRWSFFAHGGRFALTGQMIRAEYRA